jgi:uncharacterized membrane protein YccC
MPIALWYCETISDSIAPFILLALPLGGAYLYGQKQTRMAWILIAIWAVLQMGMSGLSASCPG